MFLRLFRRPWALALLITAALSQSAQATTLKIPVITGAQVSSDETLTIVGTDFITSPPPRVWIGSPSGPFVELPVISAGTEVIYAQLGNWPPGTYRLIVTFGPYGLLTSTLSLTIGAAGPAGATGATGAAGVDGAIGPTGPSGADGLVGPTGATGAPGTNGSDGAVGPTGLTGAPGDVGPIGPTGPPGPTGPAGIVGLAGKSCPDGAALSGFDATGELVCAAAAYPPAKLILEWHLDEGVGSTSAPDTSGNAFDGTVTNGDWYSDPERGTVLRFNDGGVGLQSIARADSDVLTPSTATLDLWIYPTQLNIDNQMVVHKYQNGAPGNSDYLLYFINDSLRFGTRGSEALSANLVVDQWYHIIAIANGPDSRLYVNGVLEDWGFLSSIPNGSQPFVVGTCGGSCAPNNHTFAGRIDDVRLWKGVKLPY